MRSFCIILIGVTTGRAEYTAASVERLKTRTKKDCKRKCIQGETIGGSISVQKFGNTLKVRENLSA